MTNSISSSLSSFRGCHLFSRPFATERKSFQKTLHRVQAVVENCLQLLASKARLPGTSGGQSKEAARLEIVIPPEDVGVAVMIAMLANPQMARRPEQYRT